MAKTSNKSKNGKGQKKGNQSGFGPLIANQQQAIRIVHPWSHGSTMSEAGAGLGVVYSFIVNNLYDPNFTGGGTQPIGFDQYAALYSRYRVLKAKIRITFVQRTTIPCRVGYYLSPQSTTPADNNAWLVQNKSARYKMLGVYTGGDNVADFVADVDIAQVLGLTRQEVLIDQDFSAGTGAGPARNAYLHIFTSSVGGVVATTDYTVSVWFETEWSNPIALGLS